MRFGRTSNGIQFISAPALMVALICTCGFVAQAQNTNTGTNTGGGNTGTNTGGGNTGTNNNNNNNNGNIGFQPAGVEIDAQGVLRIRQHDPRVTMAQIQAARQSLPRNLSRPSKLRMVSLNRLELSLAKKLSDKAAIDDEMLALAGLTRIEYVFYYPESRDIVIAGPAEGFARDSTGRVIGIDTGKPTLLLEDLVVALRAYPPQGDPTNVIGVSIDPTKEGLARLQRMLTAMGGQYDSPAEIPGIVNNLRQSLGLHNVTIRGVPPTTHFAHVLTEADYRMKLIGIGLEPPTVPMASYAARLTANQTSNNAMIRWYFVPDYQAIAHSEDGLAMHMVGQGVKLIGEDELVTADGARKSTGRVTNPASRAFTLDFTKKFNQIADSNPIFGQLRNLVDMSIAAAYIQDRHFYDQANWNLGVLGDESQMQTRRFAAPQQVETAVSAVTKGRRLITPIGGGVQIQARKALDPANRVDDEKDLATQQKSAIRLDHLSEGQWWWD